MGTGLNRFQWMNDYIFKADNRWNLITYTMLNLIFLNNVLDFSTDNNSINAQQNIARRVN